MGSTRPIGELRENAKRLILDKLSKISVTQASRDLGISRQAIYDFKKGRYCPSLSIVERACKTWGLEYRIKGLTQEDLPVNTGSFVKHSISVVTPPPEQITMEHLWKQLENRSLTVVHTERKDGALEMTLRISIPA
jgi:DNA-binding XRE family transcriptional regulator